QIVLGRQNLGLRMDKSMPRHKDLETETPAAAEFYRQAGLRMRVIRDLGGVTQVELCEVLRIDQSAYSKWEKGKQRPDLFVMAKWTARFQASLDLIFRGRPAGASPVLVELLRQAAPHLVSDRPTDMESNRDKALASY